MPFDAQNGLDRQSFICYLLFISQFTDKSNKNSIFTSVALLWTLLVVNEKLFPEHWQNKKVLQG